MSEGFSYLVDSQLLVCSSNRLHVSNHLIVSLGLLRKAGEEGKAFALVERVSIIPDKQYRLAEVRRRATRLLCLGMILLQSS